ncbi:hypothetical protein SO802_008136 [Lithocarpus litseifolius]|uniref:Uncharacterized protein n=1 Tax=Lithocarpus litseifolius TaxID=425828 RepID=A0AAW2D942_9ROSI
MDKENGSDCNAPNVDGFDLGSSSVAQPIRSDQIRSNPNPMASNLLTSFFPENPMFPETISPRMKPGDSFPNVCKWYDAVSSQLAARFGWSKWTLACISTMTFSDLMLKRMIARAARGILIVFQLGKEIEISNFIIDDPCIIFDWKFN